MSALADALRAARSSSRHQTAAVADTSSGCSNADLLERAEELAATVRRAAATDAATFVAVLPLSLDALVAIVAAIIADHSICLVDPATPDDRRREIIAAVEPQVVVDADGVRTAAVGGRGPSSGGPAGYVAMTSGSTGGGPKGVLCPWSTIAEFARHGAAALELESDATWAELSHPAYDMSMTNLLLALVSGAAVRVAGGLGDRVRPMRFIERTEATHVRLAPRFCDLAVAERRPRAGGALRVWGSGGDRLFAVQVRHLIGLGAPAVVNTYGTSETSGFASAARFVADDELTTVHGGVTVGRGAVGPWTVQLRDADGSAVLAITSPHLPDGYLFGASSSEYPRWESPDTVVTGDAGEQRGGELYCLGRAGRRVKRNARFVDLDSVDATIRTEWGVGAFTVAAEDGTLTTLVELPEEALADLRKGLPAVLTPDLLPERLLAVRQLPRLGNGKIDHMAARAHAVPTADG